MTDSDVDELTPANSFDEPRETIYHANTFPTPYTHHNESSSTSYISDLRSPRSGISHVDSTTSASTLVSESQEHDRQHDEEMEEAIRRSIKDASTGNKEDDEMLERAIRASVAQLEDHALETGDSREESRAIDAAMKASLKEGERLRIVRGKEDNGAQTAKESEHKKQEDEESMTAAVKASLKEHEERERERTEEEIVMAYVQKQSLMEEEHRKKMEGQNAKPAA